VVSRIPLVVLLLCLGCTPIIAVQSTEPAAALPAAQAAGAAAIVQPMAAIVRGTPNLTLAEPVDEQLRLEYLRCDREDAFHNLRFPLIDQNHHKWFPCRSDPSNLERLVQLPPAGEAKAAVVFTSKLAVDMDGSSIGCLGHGTDQCGTAIMLSATASHPCVVKSADGRTQCVPVDADRVAYVVLPLAGPPNAATTEFRDKTGIRVGDWGMVLRQGFDPVPVIVSDTGPFYKVGEGSLALHRALGHDFCQARDAAGNCTSAPNQSSIPRGVTTIVFPGSPS
jgi:hypothetical protein